MSSLIMRCGILLPSFDAIRTGQPPPIVAAAKLAEELEFDGLWIGDHLACPAPGLDAPSCLAAAAAVTEQIPLGFSVMLLGLRQPAWAAKQLTTIDVLSGGRGRLRLGVGVGGEFPQEFEAAGVPVRQRGARLDETLSIFGDLLTGRAVVHDGTTLRLTVPALEPPMAAPPPIYIGGRGEAALARAARFGNAWLPMWLTPERVAERAGRLAQLAAQRGRPCPETALLVGIRAEENRALARSEAEAHLRGQYGLGLDAVERWTMLGAVDDLVEGLEAYRDAGVGEVVFMVLGSDPLEQYERLSEVRSRLTAASQIAAGEARR